MEGALRAGTTPQVWLCQGSSVIPVPPEAALAGLWPSLIPPADPAVPGRLSLDRIPWRARSLRILVSDLLFPGGPEGSAAMLSGQHGRGVVLVPFCQAEADPAWDGNIDFEDVENGAHHPRRVDSPLLRRYLDAYARHFTLWKEVCQRHGVAMARVPSELAFPQALQLEALPTGAVEPWI